MQRTLHQAYPPSLDCVCVVRMSQACECRKARGTRSEGKELQFFSRWPPLDTDEFMSMWPEDEIAAMLNGTSRKFLIDASPEYLVMPAAPPRIKQVVPQAKIVVVLRVRLRRPLCRVRCLCMHQSICTRMHA